MSPEKPIEQLQAESQSQWDERKKKILKNWVADGIRFFVQHLEKSSGKMRDDPVKRARALFENTAKIIKALIPQEDHERVTLFIQALEPPHNENIEDYIQRLSSGVSNFFIEQYTPQRLEEIQGAHQRKRFQTLEGNNFVVYGIAAAEDGTKNVHLHVQLTFEGGNPLRLFKDGLRRLAEKMRDHPEEFVGVETITGDSPLVLKVPRVLSEELKFEVRGDHIEISRENFLANDEKGAYAP